MLWKSRRRIVREAAQAIWPDVLRKKPNCSPAELNEYTRVRAAQLVHPKMDALLKQHPQINGALGSKLLATAIRGVEAIVNQKLAELATTLKRGKAA
jgi:hypothetical protein